MLLFEQNSMNININRCCDMLKYPHKTFTKNVIIMKLKSLSYQINWNNCAQ